jgi:hypothetical protein
MSAMSVPTVIGGPFDINDFFHVSGLVVAIGSGVMRGVGVTATECNSSCRRSKQPKPIFKLHIRRTFRIVPRFNER